MIYDTCEHCKWYMECTFRTKFTTSCSRFTLDEDRKNRGECDDSRNTNTKTKKDIN